MELDQNRRTTSHGRRDDDNVIPIRRVEQCENEDCAETIDELCTHNNQGKLIGLIAIAHYRGGHHKACLAGTAKRNPESAIVDLVLLKEHLALRIINNHS